MYFIGYDIGSSSIKASVIEKNNGKVVGVTQYPDKEMQILSEKIGWAEQNPDTWWENVCEVTKKLLSQTRVNPKAIEGIGISYQMHGLVLVDKNLKPLRPSIIWCDSRAIGEGDKLFRQDTQKCTLNLLNSPGNFTLSKLKWVKENEPEVFSKVYKFMLPGDYIALKITGKCTTTPSGLSEGIMWDFKNDQPAYWLFENAGISTELIPEIVPVFSEQGTLIKASAGELGGLKEGIPVLYRAGDQPNNALSLNVFEPGDIAATGGTSGVVYAVSDKISSKETTRINNFAHVNHTKTHPRIGKLLCINGTGILYSWMKTQVANNVSYNEMNDLASQAPVGSEGLKIYPYGNGAERMLNNSNNGASIRNLNFNVHKQAHMLRASLEGIAFSFVYGMEIMREDGVVLNTIKAGGDNLFRAAIFSETISTLLEKDIQIIDTTGATGAARAAGYSKGAFKSFSDAIYKDELIKTYKPLENKEEYLEAYNNWKQELSKLY
ncbi:xylulokinase [Abyssalbus ytuae]|uniref:FGGY family carbohydrate kinase n=1 Tax=Abyssalbus ytuae TaxID=2926907 RepID=A0A9E7D179_9FLAO|nr:FGGY family carbohydrate kinase [Abyssalbus ytuae]UOB19090.1 FGGY family carbohydrate kinase [Abyssalbus ytuae]